MSSATTNRRGFLSLLTALVIGLLGLCLAIPAVAFFCGPLRRKGREAGRDSFFDVGAVKDFPPGDWRLANLEFVRENGWEKSGLRRHSVWVRRKADQAFVILSPICPHLGCPINWNTQQTHFVCPCHGGIFDVKGEVQSGPPPRAMDPLEYEVRAGRLVVQWLDFKVGVRERVPVKM